MAQNITVAPKQSHIDPREDLIEVNSAFSGLGIYRREEFLACRYAGTDDLAGGIYVADHAISQRITSKSFRIFINPALINCDKTRQDIIESVPIAKSKGRIKNIGILMFGKKRFNKYLQIMQTP
jgi:hypothetical protein